MICSRKYSSHSKIHHHDFDTKKRIRNFLLAICNNNLFSFFDYKNNNHCDEDMFSQNKQLEMIPPPPAPPAFLAVPSGMHIKVFLIFKGKLGHPLLASFGNKSELQPTSLESAVVKLNLYTNFNVVFFIFFYGFERSLGFFPPAMSFCPWLQQSESACDETVFLNTVCYSF